MNEQNLKKLWDKISAKITEGKIQALPGVSTFEDFKSKMSNETNRKAFWDSKAQIYRTHGIDEVKNTFEEFNSWLVTSAPNTQQTASDVNENNLKTLWDKISAKISEGKIEALPGVTTFEDFKSKMSDETKRRIFWVAKAEIYKSNGIQEMKNSFDEFNTWITQIPTQVTDNPPPDIPGGLQNVNWRKVAKDVWQALKDAGHYVTEKAGDFWVLLTTDGKPVKDYKTKFECIKNYTTAKQYYDPTFGNDGKRYYAILDMDFPVLKRPTKIEFYDDGTARFLYDDVNKVEQVVVTAKETGEQIVLKGTWGCQKDGKSFYMKLDNGEIIPWGNGGIPDKTDNGTNLDGGNTGAGSENLPKLKKFSEVCPSIKACPTEKQRKEGKAFKLCMKCDEIKKIQESPRFKSYYFSLLKGYGKKEESDGIFGPIMQKAVYNYQESTGIKNKYGKTTGMIGPLTYADIMKPVEVKPEDPNKNKIEQTEPPEPNEKKELQVITKDTKL